MAVKTKEEILAEIHTLEEMKMKASTPEYWSVASKIDALWWVLGGQLNSDEVIESIESNDPSLLAQM